MVQLFAEDAVLDFTDLPNPPHRGRAAIAELFADSGPDDELVVARLRTTRSGSGVLAQYAWQSAPDIPAGTIHLVREHDLIATLTVSFDPG